MTAYQVSKINSTYHVDVDSMGNKDVFTVGYVVIPLKVQIHHAQAQEWDKL